MLCSKCGKENPDEAQSCSSCGAVLTKSLESTGNTVIVKTSKLAIASFVIAFISFIILFIFFKSANDRGSSENLSILFLWLITSMTAIILGVISLIRIGLSAGRLVAIGFAVIGIAAPFSFYVLFMFIMILTPVRMRSVAYRMTCGTNLAGMGKAMLIYSGDYDEQFPRAGFKDTTWGDAPIGWDALTRKEAFANNTATISSSLYLLVKYAEMSPKSFVCSQDRGVTEFKPSRSVTGGKDLVHLWDFGPQPWKHCSYAYHTPYCKYALTASSDPSLAIAADRNPWIASSGFNAGDFSRFKFDGSTEQQKAGNSPVHNGDGQNVLYMDTHVMFETRSYCGREDDNIYTFRDGSPIRQQGAVPVVGSRPQDKWDSLLVNNPPAKK